MFSCMGVRTVDGGPHSGPHSTVRSTALSHTHSHTQCSFHQQMLPGLRAPQSMRFHALLAVYAASTRHSPRTQSKHSATKASAAAAPACSTCHGLLCISRHLQGPSQDRSTCASSCCSLLSWLIRCRHQLDLCSAVLAAAPHCMLAALSSRMAASCCNRCCTLHPAPPPPDLHATCLQHIQATAQA